MSSVPPGGILITRPGSFRHGRAAAAVPKKRGRAISWLGAKAVMSPASKPSARSFVTSRRRRSAVIPPFPQH